MAKEVGTILNDDVTPEVLASSIVKVADAAKKLLNSGLTRRALVILIKDAAIGHIQIADIDRVLDAAATLDRFVVKPKP